MRARRFLPAFLLLAIACGGGSAEPAPTSISSITIAPAVDTLVPSGWVQLLATVKDGSGHDVSSADLAWSTSDPTVATVVSTTGFVSAVKPGTVTITAAQGGKSGTATVTVADGGVVGSSGATITGLDGTVTLIVPPNALPQTVNVTIAVAKGLPAETRLITGTAVEIGPSGTAFAQPATLRIRYSPANLPAGSHPDSLTLGTFAGGAWSALAGSTVDTAGKTVEAPIAHLSTYGALTPAALASVLVLSRKLRALVDAVDLCAKHTYALLVQAGDPEGNPLPNPVTAQSSTPAVATVKQFASSPNEFFVKGVAPGTGSITFTAGSITQSVTANVTACARPDLLITSTQDGNPELYRYQAGALTRLTNNPATDELGQVSRDGSTIGFQSDRGGGDVKLYLMDPTGANVRPLLTSAGFQRAVAWGPDGTWLLGEGPKSTGQSGIYRVNADGTGATLLTTATSTEEASPAVSPDGRFIAFQQRDVSGSTPGPWHIEVAKADGSGARQLTTPGTANDQWPAFSPIHAANPDLVFIRVFTDGTWIVRTRYNGTGFAVMGGGGWRYRPTWCQDGEHVLYGFSQTQSSPIATVVQDIWIVYGDDPSYTAPGRQPQASYFPQAANSTLAYGCKP